ncbi:tail sheath protein [Arthrobacter phage Hirko]|nr:tail sheath protein [Arthrobacter phage Hirko]
MTSIGVQVTTKLGSGPSNAGTQSGRLHVAGLTAFGPVGRSTTVDSIAKFIAVYGDRTAFSSNLFDSARMYFEEGGNELVVSRVTGPAATKGALTLKDTADVDTVKIESADPGAHSADLSAEVVSNGSTFDLILRRSGVTITSYLAIESPADLVQKAATNPYVKVTSLGSVTATPGDNPKTLAVTALSAGNDDRAAVTTAHVIAALDAGTGAEGGGVAAPGYSVSQIGSLLLDHAARTGKIAYLALPATATPEEAVAAGASLAADPNGAYGGIFYPHLIIPDGGATRTISPEGYVAAVRARAHRDVGYWQVPAGDAARTRWVLGTNVQIDNAVNDTLADALVNGIVTTGSTVRLYGWQSLSADRENLGMLNARDVLNNLTLAVKTVLEPFVFKTNDSRGQLRSLVESACVGVLDPIAKRDGFYGLRDADDQIVDPGYKVSVDTSLNPITAQAENKVIVSISVRLSPVAQLIQVEIIKVPLAGTV